MMSTRWTKVRGLALAKLKLTSGILGLLLLLPITPVILLILGLLEFSDMAK